jgi:hypothetical protein
MPKIQASTIEISYQTYGDGEPLLLIMGLGLPGAAWLASLPFLTQFKCIYFDNRGTGNSDKPEAPYTFPQLTDDAGNLLDSLGIHKAKDRSGVDVTSFRSGSKAGARWHDAVGGPLALMKSLKELVAALSLQTVDQDAAADAILQLSVPADVLQL